MGASESWVWIVGRDGRIVEANPAAIRALGPVAGRRCADLMGVVDGNGQTDCGPGCAAALVDGRGGQRDRHGRVARRFTARVLCDRVGDRVVVTALPIGDAPTRPTTPLSPREREILTLVARGLTNPAIGASLGIRPATVRTHLEHARDKLDAPTRSVAVAKALALGEIQLGSG